MCTKYTRERGTHELHVERLLDVDLLGLGHLYNGENMGGYTVSTSAHHHPTHKHIPHDSAHRRVVVVGAADHHVVGEDRLHRALQVECGQILHRGVRGGHLLVCA